VQAGGAEEARPDPEVDHVDQADPDRLGDGTVEEADTIDGLPRPQGDR
jgi:hypothetical protein